MLKELSQFQNFGTPKVHYEILSVINGSEEITWLESDVRDRLYNRIIDGRTLFDGCLPLLHKMNLALKLDNGRIQIDDSFKEFLRSENLMIDRFVERLLLSLQNDNVFHNIFCSEYISWDIIYNTLQIDNSAFPLKFASFKQLLIDFKIISDHPTKEFNKFIINGRYKKIFDKIVLPEIRKRKVGVEELMKSLEQKRINGEEAEKFVRDFEEKRLKHKKEVDWVAEYSAAEGYDIASFETELSKKHDRFIEVKSYEGTPYFYWSRNEMNIARIKKGNYFLYLVDRKKMNKDDYEPMMIQNPYINLIQIKNDKWEDVVDKLRFDYIG
ncbi:MAG: DUF3883 domain-containing protein [Reichenbachiella sp.]|uniref:DUF3883 domain-containing protein n=1 Tax=Reichenbachiella sp. TaxID=2184521 RepID=UPI003296BCAD